MLRTRNSELRILSVTRSVQCLLSGSATLNQMPRPSITQALAMQRLRHWFADVLWLTSAGTCAVAERGSYLIYPYNSFVTDTRQGLFSLRPVMLLWGWRLPLSPSSHTLNPKR